MTRHLRNVARRSAALGLAILVAGAGSAWAQAAPFDMKGTWVGKGEGIVDAVQQRHDSSAATTRPAGSYRLREIDFIVKIEGQDGKRFWGSATSAANVSGRLIGSLSHDGKWIYMAGHEGILDGVVVNANTIQLCYRQVSPAVAVVACNELKRQR